MYPGDYKRLVVPKTLKEAIGKPQGPTEDELKESVGRAKLNPFFQWVISEGIYADYSQAIGSIYEKVVDAAVPALIGRELLTVIPVTKDPVKFIKAILGKAWGAGEAETPITPERYTSASVYAKEFKHRAEWSETFLEDAEWNAESRFIAEAGRAIGEFETSKIIAMFNALTTAQIAGGAEITVTDGDISFANVKTMIQKVEEENLHPKIIAMPIPEYFSLFDEAQFVNALYYPGQDAVKTGVVKTTLGVDFVRSSLVTKCLCIDTDYVVATVRRELNTKPYENPAKSIYGILVNERVGMEVLRKAAVGGRAVARCNH